MTLVDTSVWVDHLRRGRTRLRTLLESEAVLMHPFIVGEIACENVRERSRVIGDLKLLPTLRVADHDDVLRLIEGHKLCGKGIGWIDAHLVAAALISKCGFWTVDVPLARVARALGLEEV